MQVEQRRRNCQRHSFFSFDPKSERKREKKRAMTPSLRPSFFPPKIFPIVANQPFPAARMGFGELFKSSHGLAVLTISTDGLANARMKAVVFSRGGR